MKKFLTISGLVFLSASQYVAGEGAYQALIPNGTVNSCNTCHGKSFSLNPFGTSFAANSLKWDSALADLDSDGDDFTNGQELAAPDGGATPISGAQVTNPGDVASVPVLVAVSISITSPIDGFVSLDDPFVGPIVASTGDQIESITKIDFFSGEDLLGTVTELPFSLPVNLSAGSHILTAMATDYLGATGDSQPVTITVGGSTNDPLIGGTPVDGLEGWFLSEWLGYYSTAFAPWIYHAEHGWLYRDLTSTNAATYFYDDAMVAWWYTDETNYPFLYAFDPPADNGGTNIASEWLWYFEGTTGPRSFSVLTGPNAGSFLSFNP
jgi:hypothetical protein